MTMNALMDTIIAALTLFVKTLLDHSTALAITDIKEMALLAQVYITLLISIHLIVY